ncbi:hypothetical protein HRR91_007412 [Exophiala dermatitidis]|nr:hypothetical protein HRR91_007412 [Exophiala dermatitidis]
MQPFTPQRQHVPCFDQPAQSSRVSPSPARDSVTTSIHMLISPSFHVLSPSTTQCTVGPCSRNDQQSLAASPGSVPEACRSTMASIATCSVSARFALANTAASLCPPVLQDPAGNEFRKTDRR